MGKQSLQSELTRLLKEQYKTRQAEVFGGLSPVERAEYNLRTERIHEIEIQASSVPKKRAQSSKEERRSQWSREAETDTPQSEAHQPYRSREKGSTSTHAIDAYLSEREDQIREGRKK